MKDFANKKNQVNVVMFCCVVVVVGINVDVVVIVFDVGVVVVGFGIAVVFASSSLDCFHR